MIYVTPYFGAVFFAQLFGNKICTDAFIETNVSRLFVPDLLHFNPWLPGLLPEDSKCSRHSYICGERGSNRQVGPGIQKLKCKILSVLERGARALARALSSSIYINGHRGPGQGCNTGARGAAPWVAPLPRGGPGPALGRSGRSPKIDSFLGSPEIRKNRCRGSPGGRF